MSEPCQAGEQLLDRGMRRRAERSARS